MTNSVAKGKSVTLALSGKLNYSRVSLQKKAISLQKRQFLSKKRQFSKGFSCIGLAVQALTTEFVIQHLLPTFL